MKKAVLFLFFIIYIEPIFSQSFEQAYNYWKNDDYENAISQFEVLIPKLKKNFGDRDTFFLAKAFYFLGQSYYELEKYDQSEKNLLKAKQIYETYDNRKNFLFLKTIYYLALIYQETNKLSKAQSYFEYCYDEANDYLSYNNDWFDYFILNLVSFYEMIGKYEKAENLLKQLISNVDTAQNKRIYIDALNRQANLYKDLGRYEKAEAIFIELLKITKDSTILNTLYNNLAAMYSDMKLYSNAIYFYKKSLAIKAKIYGKNSVYYAITLGNLAAAYVFENEYDLALRQIDSALIITEKNLGKKSSLYARLLNYKAAIYFYKKDYRSAVRYFKKTVKLSKKSSGLKLMFYTNFLNNLGVAYKKMGKLAKAEKYIRKALKIKEQILGKNNYELLTNKFNLAMVHWRRGKYHLADSEIVFLNNISRDKLKRQFSFLTEKEKKDLWDKTKKDFDAFNSYYIFRVSEKKEFGGEFYNNALFEKGLLLRSSVAFNKLILSTKDSSLQIKFEKLRNLNQQLIREKEKFLTEKHLNTDSLELEITNLEKQLLKESKKYGNYMQIMQTDWQDIKSHLQPNEAAVEYLTFTYYDGLNYTEKTIYAAAVLKQDFEYPKIIYLFEKQTLDTILNRKYVDIFSENNAFYKAEYLYDYFSYDTLYKYIWSPIDSLLENVSVVYVSPVGMLHKIPFYALKSKEDTFRLCDKYHLYIKSTTANIIKNKEFYINANDTIALFGGINYDAVSNLNFYNKNNQLSRKTYAKLLETAKYLPGSKIEVDSIALIAEKFNLIPLKFEDKRATEKNFRSLENRNIKILHIATHGFYIEKLDTVSFYFLEPMNKSGILLSGVNSFIKGKVPSDVNNDGLLTANELGLLNFYKTNLIVLSACQTALGDINEIEGVYGLQRAVKMSGIDYMIVSLWEVDDFITTIFMKKFYENLFLGIEIEQAFFNAMNYIRFQGFRLNSNGEIETNPGKESQVYFWAPFVLIN